MKRILSFGLAAVMAALLVTGCNTKKADYVILDETLADEEYAVGFRKGDDTLSREVELALVKLKANGKLAEISKTWFGVDKNIIPDTLAPTTSTDESLAKVKSKGKFILGLDDSFPPMGYRSDDNKVVGFDIDLAREVCKILGVELEIVPIAWEAKEQELSTGKIDCIWNGLSVDPDREAAMNMTVPYMKNRQVVVTMNGSGINKLSDLKGKEVVLQGGSTAGKALDSKSDLKASLKGGKAIEVANNVIALQDLAKKGGAQAVVMDEVVARYYTTDRAALDKVK